MGLCRIALVLFFMGTGAYGAHERTQSLLGYEIAHDIAEGRANHSIFSFQDQHVWSLSKDSEGIQFYLRYKLIIDGERKETYESLNKKNLEKVIAFAQLPIENFKFSLGLQEITWGENLLLPILDVVNPRNVDYVRGFYDVDAKQPSAMLLNEWRSGEWEAQIIFVPEAPLSRQPEKIGDFKIKDDRQYKFGEDTEYGGRLGLFHEGLDTRLYYFKHHPREPSYRFLPFSGSQDAVISEQMVETTGISCSYAGYNLLFRGDLANHTNFPVTSLAAQVERTMLTQSILGVSLTTENQQTIGLELHSDLWEDLPEAYVAGPWLIKNRQQSLLNWLGFNANLSFFQSLIEPQIVFFKGIDNDDQLLRLIFLTHLNDSVNIGAEYQKTDAETSSPKLLLNRKETLALRITVSW